MNTGNGHSRRGMPLAMMGLVLAAWIGGRTMLWESPLSRAEPPSLPALSTPAVPFTLAAPAAALPAIAAPRETWPPAGPTAAHRPGGTALSPDSLVPGRAVGLAAAPTPATDAAMASRPATGEPGAEAAIAQDGPSSLPRPADARTKRLSLDAWVFLRQGSDAAPISQGRVPIYGASQAGAVLQYRLSPADRRDPRLYARAYRALVRRGESELALGASARPLPQVPVRALGELRFTDGSFRSEVRPSAFAVTEIAPLSLPLSARLETYAQAGWVGGTDDTLFADGQASVTREIERVGRLTGNAVRVSLGAGAWGGAQEGAHRVDLGPTLRIDMLLGQVPARLAVDWRERVEGDAGPDTGLAVTLSTGF